MDVQKKCSWELEPCDNQVWAKGFCAKHYKTWHRLNDTPQRQATRKADRDRRRNKLQSDPEARQAVRDYNNARYHAQSPEEKELHNLQRASYRTKIPLDDLIKEYTEHDGHCDCCGRKFSELSARNGLNVHHVHSTGKFGGFLCTNCNIAEGHLVNSDRAHKMYLFLKKQEADQERGDA